MFHSIVLICQFVGNINVVKCQPEVLTLQYLISVDGKQILLLMKYSVHNGMSQY
jgi:hypothetical protein